jgi:hypothetical protein
VAVDVAAPHAESEVAPSPFLLQRAAAVPAWVWLTGIVVASFGGRLLAAVGRVAPFYLPDEYIYPSLARGFAEHGRPLIRGVGVHFPALLEPLATAPIWLLTKDPQTAWRLTQSMHALEVSLAAVPAYLLARRVGLERWLALGVAALAVAVPDAVYAGSMLADPLAYPLVLGALCAGVSVIADSTRRAQLAFVALTALTVATRIQYAVVPFAVLLGALAADRFRVLATIKRLWLSLVLLVVPPALLFGVLGNERVLGVYAHGRHVLRPVAILQWVGRDAMLLAYSSGWVIVPGALVGIAYALVRPRTRAEVGFAVTTLALAGALLLEAAQIADTDSQRFQERYLFVLVPLLAIAFGLYVRRGLPQKLPVALVAAGLLLLAARIPLSGYAAAHNKDDSPTLWAVLRLESLVTTGNGALAVALAAAALSGLAALVGARRLPGGGALALTAAVAACCALSAGATSFDSKTSHLLRRTLPSDLSWVDHERLGAVDLIAPPGARKEQSWEQLFWNHSVERLLLLGSPEIDQFAAGRVHVAEDGRMLVDGHVLRRPMLVQTYASTVELTGAERIRHELIFDLYRPVGTPRLHLLAAGRFADGWLAPRGAITIWDRRPGSLRLRLSLPLATQVTPLHLTARGYDRIVRVHPGGHVTLSVPVPGGGPWSLHFLTPRPGYLSNDRAVSVVSSRPVFVPGG